MRLLYLFGIAACVGTFAPDAAIAADNSETSRVRRVVLSSRQMGAHGLGYGERSLNDLSVKLRPTDISTLIALLDDKNRSAGAGAIFGLASQCGAAIDPVYAMAAGATQNPKRYGDARGVLAQVANFERCADAERKRAHEKSVQLDQSEREYTSRRVQEIRRRDTEDARLQAEGIKMLDPARRAAVSREDCLAVVERNRAAAGIKPGANADPGALFERARANCMQHASRP